MDNAQVNPLVQALLNRMDHLEYKLLKDARNDVDDTRGQVAEMRDAIERMQGAERAQPQEAETSRAQIASHRGPGSEVAYPYASARQATATLPEPVPPAPSFSVREA